MDKIKDNLDAAEKAKQDIAKSEESIQDSLEEAKNERRQMIVDSKEAAAKFREDEMSKAKTDIETEWLKARSEIQREKNAAIDEVRKNFAGLVITAAEKLIDKSLDDDFNNEWRIKSYDEFEQKVEKILIKGEKINIKNSDFFCINSNNVSKKIAKYLLEKSY